jgi:2-phospho-L-lactate guanylyltransferase (CobY/MobA/RfbA family)
MSETSIPTLLVFTLGAIRERARRALVPGRLQELEISLRESCLDAALAAGRERGCRLEVCSPAPLPLPADAMNVPQPGAGFGHRLEWAMLDAFGRGAAPLIVVGTDTPGLSSRHLEQAVILLEEDADRVVLGPSPDGGFYLLAARRPVEELAAVRWCGKETLRDLLELLRAQGRPVALLEPMADLDRPADLERWLAQGAEEEGRWRGLIRLFRAAFAGRNRPLPTCFPSSPGDPSSLLAGRAPPVPPSW